MADLDKLSEEHGALKARIESLERRQGITEERQNDVMLEIAEMRGARRSLLWVATLLSSIVSAISIAIVELVKQEWHKL